MPRLETADDLRRWLWLLFGFALALRLFLVGIIEGSAPDIAAFLGVDAALRDDPLHFYAAVNEEPRFAWPYPPLYLPAVVGVSELSQAIDISFAKLIRLPEVAADLTIAWLVQWHLGYRGLSPRARFVAAAMVTLHPAAIAVSSMHGQIDPVQWLPAVAAVVAWDRLPEGRRAPVAGLLIGVGAAIKVSPGIVVLALLPLARDWRERAVLAGCAVAVPLVSLVPFLAADFSGTLSFLDYNGIPGQGGLSMLVQPELALLRFSGTSVSGFTSAQDVLQDVAPFAVIAALLGITVRLFQVRPDPAAGAAALILVVFVFGGNYFPSYAVWLIPFVVMAGWKRFYWVITALMLIPLLFRYAPSWFLPLAGIGDVTYHEWAVLLLYIPTGAALWAVYAWRLGSFARAPRSA